MKLLRLVAAHNFGWLLDEAFCDAERYFLQVIKRDDSELDITGQIFKELGQVPRLKER